MKRKAMIFSAAAVVLSSLCVSAQTDEGFDLTSQRGEVQEFNAVPGHKVDHKGLVINPTPRSIERPNTGVLNISGGFALKDRKGKFAGDVDFLRLAPKGLPLNIDFGAKQAEKAGVKAVSGAYLLSIGPKSVDITGYDERGAFYGLQTLRQILESRDKSKADDLDMMVINDYPELPYRGVVEGFYGTPWSHDVRMSLIDFYGRNKLSDYLYGPKDDPYHSSPNWRKPYPHKEARDIEELVQQARRNRVNFIWAIHPGKDIRWNKEDYDSLVAKFNMMYDLGVRSFAIFFDDIEGEGTNPHKQVELLNALTRDFVKAKGDVTNLIVCPTDYSQLWAKPGPDGPLAIYGRELDPSVEVFWTGAVVCSDLTPETLDFVNSRIKRPALYWWNYPVTDYCKHILMQGPVYGLDTNLTSADVAGIESNPMEHGEASKLALYGVADYGWNPGAYNPIDNWERGLVYMMPDAADAYRTFAIHSTDTETGYRRDESWETTTFPYNRYTPEQFAALKAEFEKIVKVEDAIRKGCTNAGLLAEMKPWLTEFTKLGKRGLAVMDLIKSYPDNFWPSYVAALMTDEDRKAYEAHKIGTMKLQPFYDNAMNDMAADYFEKLTGHKPSSFKGIGSYPNLRTTLANLMVDNDTTNHYTSGNSQKAGDWIGLDLLTVRPLYEVKVLQGRNSVDDCDFFDNVALEYSVDGKTWTALTPDLKDTYVVTWKGEPVNARYVRLARRESNRSNWATVREFMVNPVSAERVGLNVVSDLDSEAALAAFDSNPFTAFELRNLDARRSVSLGQLVFTAGMVEFDVAKDAKELVMLLGEVSEPVKVRQFDAKGNELKADTVTESYATVALDPKAVRVKADGRATIYEIVQR